MPFFSGSCIVVVMFERASAQPLLALELPVDAQRRAQLRQMLLLARHHGQLAETYPYTQKDYGHLDVDEDLDEVIGALPRHPGVRVCR